jgi:hypothetical protein
VREKAIPGYKGGEVEYREPHSTRILEYAVREIVEAFQCILVIITTSPVMFVASFLQKRTIDALQIVLTSSDV